MRDCIAADDGGTREPEVFLQRTASLQQAAAVDPLRRAALARVPFYRLPPIDDKAASEKPTRSALIRETVSAADAPPTGPAAATVDKRELSLVPGFDPHQFYPSAALRAEVGMRVSATCRVLADHSMWCRDARIDLPPVTGDVPMRRDSSFDAAFKRATTLALATGRVRPTLASGNNSVGCEARLTIHWAPG